MEVRLAGSFLPLLLLTWLPGAGLTHQISAVIDVSVGLDLVLQCLLQTGLSSTAREVKWFNTTQNNREKQNEGGVEMKQDSTQLVFTSVNKAHTGSYTCRMENTTNTPKGRHKSNKDGAVSESEESVITAECRFKISSENLMVHMMWYRLAGLEAGNQTTALGENCTNLTWPGVLAVNMRICGCRVFITRINLSDTGKDMQGRVARFDFHLCIIFGLALGTLLYMPVIGLLLWQCRRSRKAKLTSRQVAEGNQLSMAVPVTGTKDLTYANLRFENRAKPASSNIIYTEIKPSQQKQSGRDASAASIGVDVFCKGEGM